MKSLTHHPPHVVQAIRRAVAVVIIAVVLFIGLMKLGVYVLDWQSPTTIAVLRYIPLPAVMIDWRTVSQRDYLVQLHAMRHYNQVIASATTGVYAKQTEAAMQQTTLRKLIRDQATAQLLSRYHLALSATDIDRAFAVQVLQNGNRQTTAAAIQDMYQWSLAQYKHYVVSSAVAREKLREYLSFHAPFNRQAETQAKAVMKLVQDGDESFETLAKQFSEDQYAANGGLLEPFHRGEYDSAIEDVAFQLVVGATSDLIHTKFGWHIVQLVEKKTVNGQEEVQVRQIFIAGPNIDQVIDDELKSHRIGIWTKSWQWNAKKADVEPS